MKARTPVPRIDCELCHDLLDGYVVGQLGRAVAASVERHYFGCAACFDLLQTYRATQVILQSARGEIRAAPWRRPGLAATLQSLVDRVRRGTARRRVASS